MIEIFAPKIIKGKKLFTIYWLPQEPDMWHTERNLLISWHRRWRSIWIAGTILIKY